MNGVYLRGTIYWISYNANRVRYREKIGLNKKLAEAVLCKRKLEIAEGRFLEVKRFKKIKFSDFAQEYLRLHASQKKSETSHFKNCVNRLSRYFGNYHLHEITVLMVEGHKARRRKEEVSEATVNRELACLKSMINRAIHWGYLKENPVTKVKLFKENNQRLRYLEKEEIEKLLSVCSSRLQAVVRFAINTGMRKGEIQNLKWGDINFQRGFIVLRETKNGETRYLPTNQTVRDILISTPKHPESPYVFCAKDGEPYNFRQAFNTARDKAEIVDFRFHDLRHTFASHLAMSGVDLNTIRELLGHKSLDMTLRYSHLSQDHKTRAVSALDHKIGCDRSQIGHKTSIKAVCEKNTISATSFELVG